MVLGAREAVIIATPDKPIRSSRARRLLTLGMLPVLGATLFLAIAGWQPLRFDRRTLQMQARLEPLGLPRGASFLVCTRANSVASAELAHFALSHWSFPRGARLWLTLSEDSHDVWSGGFLAVDTQGRFQAPRVQARGFTLVPETRPAGLDELLAASRSPGTAAVIYEDEATRREFALRLPALAQMTPAFVLGQGPASRLPLAAPTWLFTWRRCARLSALAGTLLVAVLLAQGLVRPGTARRLLASALGFVAGVMVLLALTYLAGRLRAGLGTCVPFVLWALGAWLLTHPAARGASAPTPRRPRAHVAALVLASVVYVSVGVLRLDFDGDSYTTYLPAARYVHLLGRHEPRDPGLQALVQGAVYPPGAALLLALPAWVLDQPGLASYAIGADTSAAILLYRLLVVGLDLALLAALAAYLMALSGGGGLALAGVLGALLLLPPLRGLHTAAETLLIPAVGIALVALAAGARLDEPRLACLGLGLAALGTLVKLEGLPALVLLALPTLAAGGAVWLRRQAAALAIAFALGLLPFAVWRLSGPASNASFGSMHALGSEAWRTSLLPLLAEAVRLMIKSELWVAFGLLLPAASVARLLARQPWRESWPGLGCAALVCAWIGVYSLSTLGALSHMETSFARICLLPAFAALLFALESVALLSPPVEAV